MAISRYQKKISGPLLDRIDIHVEVPRVDYEKLADKRNVEDSKTIRAQVQATRERQLERFTGTKLTCNAEMGPTEVRQYCQTDASGEKLLKAAVQQLHVSARAYHRVLKLARTIADLAGSEMIAANHVAEAVQYRPRVGMQVKLSISLLFPWFSFREIKSLIDIYDVNLHIDALDLNDLPWTIMTIMPGSNILIVTLPYFHIWRKLTHQHYFLHGWASLVGFELHATIASFSAG
jgi:hypothetical protein